MSTILLLLVGGGFLLVVGAELLVRGASRIAISTGISPLVVGLTVVAFGTSSPELAVTVDSAMSGNADVALGNVVGSNIFNVLFILGVAALVTPLGVDRQLIRFDIPVMIGASVLTLLLALDGHVGMVDGIVLLTGLVVYTGTLVRQSRKAAKVEPELPGGGPAEAPAPRRILLNVGLALIGLVLLVIGARWFVQAAVEMAGNLGVSELVIGLTIVAAGTSLPEVATSVLASFRGQRDIAVGNVIGSNIFNLFGVLGAGAVLGPDGIGVSLGALTFDIPVMIAVALAALPMLFSGWLVSRWEGALFLLWYVAYTGWLIVDSTAHQAQDELQIAILGFVLPFSAVYLLLSWFHGHSAARKGAGSGG